MHVKCQYVATALIVVVALLVFTSTSAALENQPPPAGGGEKVLSSYLSQRETWAALAVLIFGSLMALSAFVILRAGRLPIEPVIRITALILIVTGTLFLVAAGYDANQIAPALGLLGSIAGYLLGQTRTTHQENKTDETP